MTDPDFYARVRVDTCGSSNYQQRDAEYETYEGPLSYDQFMAGEEATEAQWDRYWADQSRFDELWAQEQADRAAADSDGS